MSDQKRFDPVGWFVSACVALLFGAVALALAVSLIQHIWVWLVLIIAAAGVITVLVRLAIWWSRRQPW